MRAVMRILVFLACAALMPTIALAQAVIAGSVKDSSGAVLPGVNVEATSPELIEKIRTAVTDGTGQYRIEDLRPGAYTVTFTLPGFTTLKREGIELTGTFVATINVELKIGAVAETVTVTGESPVVNIQSARREMTLNNDVLKAIPTVRSYNATVSVVPGVTTNLNDVVTATATTQFPIHGGRNNEGRLMIDGLNIGNPPGGNQPTSYVANVGNAQEVTFTRSPNPTHDLIGVVEQCVTGCPANGGIPGLVYRSQDWGQNYAGSYSWRASASNVTGWQSLKVGYQGTYLSDIRTYVDSIAFRAAERGGSRDSCTSWLDYCSAVAFVCVLCERE